MASQYKMVGLMPDQKEILEETREMIEEQDGHKPTQGETVVMACEALREVRA